MFQVLCEIGIEGTDMLLRRITKHVREQNWFAVFLDFFIVVVGILIAFQITNWSEARNDGQLREFYLERLQSDLSMTSQSLAIREQRSAEILGIIDAFATALNNPETSDEDLVDATRDYFSKGSGLPDFTVVRTTFDGLASTGNLGILDNQDLAAALTDLNADYALQIENVLLNTDWLMPVDSEMVSEFDWMRFDDATEHLFPEKTHEEIAASIRSFEDKMRRNAALHYWFVFVTRRDYSRMIAQTDSVLADVEAEMK